VIEIAIEILIEIGMEQSRLFHCDRFHCAENRQSGKADFFGKWVELMNIYVARVLCMTQ